MVKQIIDGVNLTEAEVLALEDLSDVTISSLSNNDLLMYNSSSSEWENTRFDATGYVPYTGATANLVLGAYNITAANLNISNWDTAYGWGDHSIEGYLKNIVEDTTPQLGGNLDGQTFAITTSNFISSVAIGTSPYACTSTTLNTNLNADMTDGYHLDQAVTSGASPTFDGANFTGIPDGALDNSYLYADGSRELTDDWETGAHNVILTSVTGNEKLTNNDFAAGSTGWTFGTGWLAIAGMAAKISDGTGTVSQTSAAMVTPLVVGEIYTMTYTIKSYQAGSLIPTCGGHTFDTISANGTYSSIFRATSTDDLIFTPTNDGRFWIDKVSLTKESGVVSGNSAIFDKSVLIQNNTNDIVVASATVSYVSSSYIKVTEDIIPSSIPAGVVEFDGYYIEFLDGALAGQSQILTNSADLTPDRLYAASFSGASVGDHFKITHIVVANLYVDGKATLGDIEVTDRIKFDSTYENTALGYKALGLVAGADSCSAVGFNALYSNTTGDNNTAIGHEALYNNTTSGSSTAIGYRALKGGGGYAAQNTAIGANAMFSNTTGGYNNAMGTYSLYNNTEGQRNNAMGYGALYDNVTGGDNSAVGNSALWGSTGDQNVGIGMEVFGGGNVDSRNIGIGYSAGRFQTGVSDKLLIDNRTRGDAATELTNSIIYGVMAALPADQDLFFNADVFLRADNRKSYHGAGDDGCDYYDGTNFIRQILTTGDFRYIGGTGFTTAGFMKNDASGLLSGGNSIDISADTNLSASSGVDLTGDLLTAVPGEIDYDSLLNFLANEHIDWTAATQNLSTSGTITSTNATTGQSTIAKGLVVNSAGGGGADDDFRAASDNVASALLVDASADEVQINTTFIPYRSSAATEPTLSTGELLVWRDSTNNKVYMVYNDTDEGQKKIELI